MYDVRCVWIWCVWIWCETFEHLLNVIRTIGCLWGPLQRWRQMNSFSVFTKKYISWCRLCCRVMFSCFGGHRMEWCRAALATVTQLWVFVLFHFIHCFEYKWMNEERMCYHIPKFYMSITKFNYELRLKLLNENELNNYPKSAQDCEIK